MGYIIQPYSRYGTILWWKSSIQSLELMVFQKSNTKQAGTNICEMMYQDANIKICLSLFGWKENILYKTVESLCISGQFRLTGNNLSTSYEALDFCWQIAVNSPQHLRPCHIFIVYVCIVYDHSISVLNFSRARYLKRFSFISNSRLKQTDSLLQINGNVAWSNYQPLTPFNISICQFIS